MCGIAGIFNLIAQDPVDRGALKRMADAIAHRGPDGEGFHEEGGVGLAHRRLAIIDLAGGQQPLFNEDHSVSIVFNGEIYNFQDLVSELTRAGHVFRTHCDTEVIVHAWEEWGADCVTRLRGMFALAIYDRRQDCLFLARDRFGKKPLYYTITADHTLLFASELKALLTHPKVQRTIDPVAVDNYLAYGYVPDPATIYAGVCKLPPAHVLTLQRGRLPPQPQCYWRLQFDAREQSEGEAVSQLRDRLSEATRIRLMSDVPLGAFLSGGVDSSGVVAMMAHLVDSPIKTFAIGFGKGGTDELSHAARVASRYQTIHRAEEIDVDPLRSYRVQARIFDEPFADSSAIPTYHVCKMARKNVAVSLSGDAGDEVFAGYRRHALFGATEAWRRVLPAPVRGAVFGALGAVYPKLDWAPRWMRAKYTFLELAASSSQAYYRMQCRVQDAMRWAIYSPSMRARIKGHDPSLLIAQAMEQSGSDDPITRALYTDIKTWLVGDILTKVDRASMAVSLEVRVPMLDHVFVEWAAKLPTSLKLHAGEGKYILKKALEDYVPHENLYRSKQGFATSLAPHFRTAGEGFLKETLCSEVMADSGIFDMAKVAGLIKSHMTGRADRSLALWTLLMFEGFLSEVHGKEASRPPETLAYATS